MALDITTARTEIAKIYIAAFDRAPDVSGLNFWVNTYMAGTDTLTTIAEKFTNSDEYKTTYPSYLTNAEFVEKVYINVFDRASDADGKAFWVNHLAAGTLNHGTLMKAMVDAAMANTSTDGSRLTAEAEAGVAAAVAEASTNTLTSGNDNFSGTLFEAPQTYTPGGNDRINSLQDNDKLTGTGTADVLNVTIGHNADTADLNIMPTLTSIDTVNIAFDATDFILDMQDSTGTTTEVNVKRMEAGATNAVQNMAQVAEKYSVTSSNTPAALLTFDFTENAANGATDETILALNSANLMALRIDSGVNEGIETINMQSNTASNTVNTLTAEDLKTLNISGSQNLTLGTSAVVNRAGTTQQEATAYTAGLASVSGSLSTVDASTMTGSLDITLGTELNAMSDVSTGTAVAFTVKGGTAADKIRLADGVVVDTATGNIDVIEGGEGTDTLVLQGDNVITATTAANIKSVEALEIRSGLDNDAAADTTTVDAAAFDSLATIYVKNDGQNANATTAESMTVNLNNLTAAQSLAITLAHSTTANNTIANNNLNIDIATALETSTTDTATVTLVDSINTDVRFNAIINAADYETFVIQDNDTESNTIALAGEATHTTKVTIIGGEAGDFINLDTTTAGANGGIYGYDVTGTTTDATATTAGYRQTADQSATVNQIKLNAATVDASAAVSDVIVRVDTNAASVLGAQTITMGTGNDTVIFDLAADTRAGLTISDTVTGGTGTDTLVIDGNLTVAGTIALGASEWTNVSGFETIKLVGAGAGSNYSLTLTDTLITNNNLSGNLSIVNDNDGVNDTISTPTAAVADTGNGAAESAVTIDARSLTALTSTKKFSYNGEEGASRTADTLIFSDANMNGYAVIDGGAIDNVNNNRGLDNSATTTVVEGNATIANRGNADIIEVRNSAVVSTGDLENVSNIGELKFTNDLAVTQVSTLQLNDSIVDRMVDSYQASVSRSAATAQNVEVLEVTAVDNMNVANATTGMTIEASALTDKSDLSILLGRGANNVVTGEGQDSVVLLGNYLTGTYAATVNSVALNTLSTTTAVARAVTDTINLGAGTDTLTTYGAINLAGATLVGIENLVANSDVTLTAAQFNALSSIKFEGGVAHAITITTSATDTTAYTIDMSKVQLASSATSLTVTTAPSAGSITTSGTPQDGSTVGGITVNGSAVTTVDGTNASVAGSTSGTTGTTTGGDTTGTTTTTATIAVAATGANTDGDTVATTYNIAAGNYTYTITGFDVAGDVLHFTSTDTLNFDHGTSTTDGTLTISYPDATTGTTASIVLVGLTDEASINGINSFNTFFGADSLI